MFTDLVVLHNPLPDQMVHLVLEGDLCLSTLSAAGQHNLFSQLLDKGERRIILDLSGIRYVDSSGVSWLIAAHRQCRDTGVQLTVIPPAGRDSQIFQLLRGQKLLDFSENTEDARRFILERGPV